MSSLRSSGHTQLYLQRQDHGLKPGKLADNSPAIAVGRATYSFINKGIINTYTAEITADGRVINSKAFSQVDGHDVAAVTLTPKVVKQFEEFAIEDVKEAREKSHGQYIQVHGNITLEADYRRKTLLDKASTEDVLQKIMSMRTQTTGKDFTPEQMRIALKRDPKAILDWAQTHPNEAQAKLSDPRYACIARQYAAENPNTTISITFKRLSASGLQSAMIRPNSDFGSLY